MAQGLFPITVCKLLTLEQILPITIQPLPPNGFILSSSEFPFNKLICIVVFWMFNMNVEIMLFILIAYAHTNFIRTT